MTNREKIIVWWEPWMNAYRAYSDVYGAEDSPYGDGKTREEAIKDLEWQLEEMEDKKRETQRLSGIR